jgi:protein-L-isoaspartate(D-aspartate) O-methyltransferase
MVANPLDPGEASEMPRSDSSSPKRRRERRWMIEQIERHFRSCAAETGERELDPRVREAVEKVPRHEFVPEAMSRSAYDDGALPIGSGQTISQPFIVALMTQLARIEAGSRVLEIGTGCGYQAAVLAEIAQRVLSIERIAELGERASATLARLGYTGVEVRIGDGYAGWPEEAPFDAVVVTAAAQRIPPPLVEQLAPGGRMVIPVASARGWQDLLLVTKDDRGEIAHRSALPVAFVPLVHETDASDEDALG